MGNSNITFILDNDGDVYDDNDHAFNGNLISRSLLPRLFIMSLVNNGSDVAADTTGPGCAGRGSWLKGNDSSAFLSRAIA